MHYGLAQRRKRAFNFLLPYVFLFFFLLSHGPLIYLEVILNRWISDYGKQNSGLPTFTTKSFPFSASSFLMDRWFISDFILNNDLGSKVDLLLSLIFVLRDSFRASDQFESWISTVYSLQDLSLNGFFIRGSFPRSHLRVFSLFYSLLTRNGSLRTWINTHSVYITWEFFYLTHLFHWLILLQGN